MESGETITSTTGELLAEYRGLEARVELEARFALFDLAEWLAENVPVSKGGRPAKNSRVDTQVLTIAAIAKEGIRGAAWLNRVRKVGLFLQDEKFGAGRLPVDKTVSDCAAALEQAGGDADKAWIILTEDWEKAKAKRAAKRAEAEAKREENTKPESGSRASNNVATKSTSRSAASEEDDTVITILNQAYENLTRLAAHLEEGWSGDTAVIRKRLARIEVTIEGIEKRIASAYAHLEELDR